MDSVYKSFTSAFLLSVCDIMNSINIGLCTDLLVSILIFSFIVFIFHRYIYIYVYIEVIFITKFTMNEKQHAYQ